MLTGVDLEMSRSLSGEQPSMSPSPPPSLLTICRVRSHARYAETHQHNYYDKDFKGTAFEFAAMIFETTGAVNSEGLDLLRQLFRFAAKHQSRQLSVYCGRAWARLSCSLQSSVSQCFLNRAGSQAAAEKDTDLVDG